MRKVLCILVLLAAIVSCTQGNVVEKPENLVTEDQMVNMLYDLSLMQASYSVGDVQNKRIDGLKFLKEKYGVDSVTFAGSNKYYASHPEQYQKIHRQIFEMMEAEKAKLSKAKPQTAAEKQLEKNRPTP